MGECTKLAPMLHNRSLHSLTGSTDYLVATGGGKSEEIMKTAEEYDPKTCKWTQLPDMNKARKSHGSCSLNGRVYIFGRDSEKGIEFHCGGRFKPWK